MIKKYLKFKNLNLNNDQVDQLLKCQMTGQSAKSVILIDYFD